MATRRKKPRDAQPPCPDCGWDRCKSHDTMACWVRCFGRALAEASYDRSFGFTSTLRKAEIPIILAPVRGGCEVPYAPKWAIEQMGVLRQHGLPTLTIIERLERDSRLEPPPAVLVERLEELRAFALLRGWRLVGWRWYR